jgi:hypothetical protein
MLFEPVKQPVKTCPLKISLTGSQPAWLLGFSKFFLSPLNFSLRNGLGSRTGKEPEPVSRNRRPSGRMPVKRATTSWTLQGAFTPHCVT